MSILGSILGKLFPSSHVQGSAGTASAAGTAATSVAPAATPPSAPSTPSASTAPAAAAPAPAAMAEVDVEKQLDGMAANAGEKLNWKTSIVDLMTLLGLDSSINARKELAKELSYSGDMNDSAMMNVWLHRQVMNKVAANGGKVPADLKD